MIDLPSNLLTGSIFELYIQISTISSFNAYIIRVQNGKERIYIDIASYTTYKIPQCMINNQGIALEVQ